MKKIDHRYLYQTKISYAWFMKKKLKPHVRERVENEIN